MSMRDKLMAKVQTILDARAAEDTRLTDLQAQVTAKVQEMADLTAQLTASTGKVEQIRALVQGLSSPTLAKLLTLLDQLRQITNT